MFIILQYNCEDISNSRDRQNLYQDSESWDSEALSLKFDGNQIGIARVGTERRPKKIFEHVSLLSGSPKSIELDDTYKVSRGCSIYVTDANYKTVTSRRHIV